MINDHTEFFAVNVTKATVEQYAEQTDLVPYQIDGIPEGFSWYRDQGLTIDKLTHVGYLFGFTPHMPWKTLGAMFYKPIVLKQDATEEERNQEFAAQAEALVKLYNENVKLCPKK